MVVVVCWLATIVAGIQAANNLGEEVVPVVLRMMTKGIMRQDALPLSLSL